MNTNSDSTQSTWHITEDGTTIGQKGSENGIILQDEEHQQGARVTLERDGHIAPFSVTCGVYGLFVHTAFASTGPEGLQKYVAMRQQLEAIIASPEHDVTHLVRAFVDAF